MVVRSAGAIWQLPSRRNSACNKEAVSCYGIIVVEKGKVFIDRSVGIVDINEYLRGN